jgi:agmatinase
MGRSYEIWSAGEASFSLQASWQSWHTMQSSARLAGRRVYLTIDVDGLDPAIVPATGTPEPDGLSWNETLAIVRSVAQDGRIVGIDCVELAPVAGLHAADFAVAKLLYKAITYAVIGRNGGNH